MSTCIIAQFYIIYFLFPIIFRQEVVILVWIIPWHTVLVLGIHKATTHLISLHIDQVELNHTGDIAIVLFFCSTVFCSQFQEYT